MAVSEHCILEICTRTRRCEPCKILREDFSEFCNVEYLVLSWNLPCIMNIALTVIMMYCQKKKSFKTHSAGRSNELAPGS